MKFFVFHIHHAIFILLIKNEKKIGGSLYCSEKGTCQNTKFGFILSNYVFYRSQWVYITPTNDCNTVLVSKK